MVSEEGWGGGDGTSKVKTIVWANAMDCMYDYITSSGKRERSK